MKLRTGRRTKNGWSGRLIARPPRWRGWKVAGNLGLLLAVWVAGVAPLHLGGGPQRHAGLADGQRAPATVVAAVDFECQNIAATELLRRQAADAVVPVFAIQMGPLQAAWRTLEKLADRATALRRDLDKAGAKATGSAAADPAATAKSLESGLAVAADLLGVTVSGEALAALFPPGKEMDALSALKEGLSGVWLQGILSDLDRESSFQGLVQSPTIDILVSAEAGEPAFRTVTLVDLPAAAQALETFVTEAGRRLEKLDIAAAVQTLEDLARPVMRPNLGYDERLTEDRRTAARRDIAPVLMTVRAGTTLMEEGTTVAPQTVEMINAYDRRLEELESPRDRGMRRLGDSALMLVVLALCATWLQVVQPQVVARPRRKLLMAVLALLAIVLASLFRNLAETVQGLPPWLVSYAVPLALPAMLAMLVLGAPAALAAGLWSGLVAALIFGRSFDLLLLGLAESVAAVVLLRNVRKRSQVMRAGAGTGLVAAALALVLAALAQYLPATFLAQAGTGLANGILTAILALLLLPFLEWLFRYTTNLSLLELTDMSHPLLQRLALEAPGTYHHSLMVGALARAAATRIGANSLLVSVCAYFHDIGKLAKPEFFSENQRGGENPHDQLAPSMSALVIQSHVKEGLTLAKRYKLPQPVGDAIVTHQGTTLTSYFYQVARQALREAGTAEDSGLEQAFRYDGPKPWTREQAVLMLADSVEAASRSLEKPTPNRIAEMVDGILRDKLLDGQLDLCPLTMRELNEIRASFVFSLSNMLHGRNPYPREDQPGQPAAEADAPAGGAPSPGPDADAPGVSG